MDRMKKKQKLRKKRAMRKRKKITGTPERPRLSVFRSLKQINAQLIIDTEHRTCVSLSSLSKEVVSEIKKDATKTEIAGIVGRKLGEISKEKGIERVYFDVGHYRYHGRIKALAEGFIKSGIRF